MIAPCDAYVVVEVSKGFAIGQRPAAPFGTIRAAHYPGVVGAEEDLLAVSFYNYLGVRFRRKRVVQCRNRINPPVLLVGVLWPRYFVAFCFGQNAATKVPL